MRLLMNQRLLPKSDRFCIGTFRSIRLESSSFRSINQQPLSAKESFNGLDSTSNHSFPTTWNSDHAIAESDGSTVFSTEDSTVFESFNQFLDDKMCSFSNEVFEVAEHITQESQNQVDRPVHRKRNIDRMYMSMHFKQTILPYLHACVNSTMTDRAFSTVNWYNFKNGMFDNCDASMIRDVCNVLLKGYALENRLNGLHEVFKVMRHFDVQPDLKSYAWYLYILSKNNRIKLATNVIAKMEHDGLVLSDMFCQSNLNLDQRFVVQKFIHKFKPQLAFTDLQVNNEPGCEIVKDLYDRPRSEYVPMKRFDLTEFRSALDEQMEMEKQGRVTIKSVYETKATGQTQFCRDELTRLEQEWKTVLVASLKQNLQVIQNKYSDMNGMNVYPYLCSLDLNATVDMMVDEAIMLGRMNGTYSPPSYINYLNLGRRIQNHYLTQILLKNFPEGIELYESYLKYYTDPELIGRLNTREHWQKLAVEKRLYASPDVKDMTWPYAIIISIGKMMYEIMLRELKIDANLFKETHKKRMVPAFLTIYTRDKVKLQEEIRCNVAFSKLFQEAQMDKIYFDPSMLPMLVPPVPWINPKRGGYLFTNVEIIRENLNEVAMCRDKLQNRNLNTIYDALNVVSMCPWKVNQPVLDVMIEIFNQNGNVDLDIPIHNSSMPQPQSAKDCNNKEERVALIRKRFKQRKENTEMYSLWCECQYKLSIANHVC